MAKSEHDLVTTQHPDYAELHELREVIEHLRSGTRELREECSTYLPKFEAESKDSYDWRVNTSTFLNLYTKMEDTFVGFTFQDEIQPQSDVPKEIIALMEDIDNQGSHFDVFARQLFKNSFDGASCFFVDYPPKVEGIATSLQDRNRRPFWIQYEQDAVINWKRRPNPTTQEMEFTLIVLKEVYDESPNLFQRVKIDRWKVLFLDENNQCNYRIYERRKNEKTKRNEIQLIDEGLIYKASTNGIPTPFDKIPFVVLGDLCDAPPLMDIADKNIEHFQTYSDYKSLIHKTCVPVPFTKGESEIKQISGDNLVEVPIGGDFGFAEVAGTSLAVVRQALEDIKTDIGLLGMSKVVQGSNEQAQVTATEILIDSIEDTSFLAVRARALKDALEAGLMLTAEYMGLPQGGSIELGTAWAKAQREAEQQDLMNQSDSNNNTQGDALTKSVTR